MTTTCVLDLRGPDLSEKIGNSAPLVPIQLISLEEQRPDAYDAACYPGHVPKFPCQNCVNMGPLVCEKAQSRLVSYTARALFGFWF
jgi:hypothetical protein